MYKLIEKIRIIIYKSFFLIIFYFSILLFILLYIFCHLPFQISVKISFNLTRYFSFFYVIQRGMALMKILIQKTKSSCRIYLEENVDKRQHQKLYRHKEFKQNRAFCCLDTCIRQMHFNLKYLHPCSFLLLFITLYMQKKKKNIFKLKFSPHFMNIRNF